MGPCGECDFNKLAAMITYKSMQMNSIQVQVLSKNCTQSASCDSAPLDRLHNRVSRLPLAQHISQTVSQTHHSSRHLLVGPTLRLPGTDFPTDSKCRPDEKQQIESRRDGEVSIQVSGSLMTQPEIQYIFCSGSMMHFDLFL